MNKPKRQKKMVNSGGTPVEMRKQPHGGVLKTGNPGNSGRPRGIDTLLREQITEEEAVELLVGLARDKNWQAVQELLNRMFGKVPDEVIYQARLERMLYVTFGLIEDIAYRRIGDAATKEIFSDARQVIENRKGSLLDGA